MAHLPVFQAKIRLATLHRPYFARLLLLHFPDGAELAVTDGLKHDKILFESRCARKRTTDRSSTLFRAFRAIVGQVLHVIAKLRLLLAELISSR